MHVALEMMELSLLKLRFYRLRLAGVVQSASKQVSEIRVCNAVRVLAIHEGTSQSKAVQLSLFWLNHHYIFSVDLRELLDQ